MRRKLQFTSFKVWKYKLLILDAKRYYYILSIGYNTMSVATTNHNL